MAYVTDDGLKQAQMPVSTVNGYKVLYRRSKARPWQKKMFTGSRGLTRALRFKSRLPFGAESSVKPHTQRSGHGVTKHG